MKYISLIPILVMVAMPLLVVLTIRLMVGAARGKVKWGILPTLLIGIIIACYLIPLLQ